MYLLYSLLLGAGALLASPYLLYQAIASGKYRPSLKERLGLLPPSLNAEGRSAIWVHAVSVGEVTTARPLLKLLREAFPDLALFLSTTTVSGRRLAEGQLRDDVEGLFYCPFDLRFAVRRVVRQVHPRLLLLVDTEIWPHLLRACHEAGAKTLVVNGRISDRSFPRYRWVRPLMRRLLGLIDHFCMQSPGYADRIVALGAEPSRVTVTGSLKFDAASAAPEPNAAVRLIPPGRPVLVAGSTLAPEEDILLEVFARLKKSRPALFLVLAPRHPERFSEVAVLAEARGFRAVRRSSLERPPTAEAEVMVLDTLGELGTVYSSAALVFVGGSLAPWGGHNLIEPAAWGKPVLFGPHMANFAEIAAAFLESQAAIQVADRADLASHVERLLDDPALRTAYGERARRLVEANRGAAERTVAVARRVLGR
jgi:3-deoxy-D-manno-octulosonic-acid transferase